MQKIINKISKAIFGMPPPSVKVGDLFFEYPTCKLIEVKGDIQKRYILAQMEVGVMVFRRVQKIKKLQIDDKLISVRGVLTTIDTMADMGIISPYKENWYKILPM